MFRRHVRVQVGGFPEGWQRQRTSAAHLPGFAGPFPYIRTPALYSHSWQATTPVDPRALDAMLPFLTDQYGNPHSRTHAYGWEAEKAVEEARKVRHRILSRSSEC